MHLFCSLGEYLPETVGVIREHDGLKPGSKYSGATVYYPTEGSDSALGSIVIVPGLMNPQTSMQEWGPFYASNGIVAMTIGTLNLTDMVDARIDALLDALDTLRAENERPGSPLKGRLDTNRFAVSGWSMGGAAAYQVASSNAPGIRAVISLCPKAGFHSAAKAPMLVIAGEMDHVTPPEKNAMYHYNDTANGVPKLFFEVHGEGHFVGNGPSGGSGEVGDVALAWLQLFLQSNHVCSAQELLGSHPSSASCYMHDNLPDYKYA